MAVSVGVIVVVRSRCRKRSTGGEIGCGAHGIRGAGGMDGDAVAGQTGPEPLAGALGQDGIESECEQRMVVAVMIVQ